MKIGLHDADAEQVRGKAYPNYALMKISAWHKAQGDAVEWWSRSKDMTGYDVRSKLPLAIDDTYPDYTSIQPANCSRSVANVPTMCLCTCW